MTATLSNSEGNDVALYSHLIFSVMLTDLCVTETYLDNITVQFLFIHIKVVSFGLIVDQIGIRPITIDNLRDRGHSFTVSDYSTNTHKKSFVIRIQSIQCFIIVLYVFTDVCAFDTYNKHYLPYLLI